MLEVVVSGLVTGWAIAVPVGAVAALLVTLTARTSWRVGAAAGLGIATVDGVYAAAAVVSGAALATLLEPVAWALTIWGTALYVLAGVFYLVQVGAIVRAERSGRVPGTAP